MLETLLQPNETVERCGLILRDGSIVEVQNVAQHPEQSFEMDPVAVLPHLKDAVSTWHTHPDSGPVLSGADYKGFLLWPNLEHAVVSPLGVKRYCVREGIVEECV